MLLRPLPKLKKTSFEFDFAELAIKGRASKGNRLTKNPVRQITKREDGVSTLGARSIWYDETVKRLNIDGRGQYLGDFMSDDRLLAVMSNGDIKLSGYDLSTHFEEDMQMIRKYEPDEVLTVAYIEGETGYHYIKRFQLEEETPSNKRISSIGDHPGSRFVMILFDELPKVMLHFKENEKGKRPEDEEVKIVDFIGVKSLKAKGKRVSTHVIDFIEVLPPDEPEPLDDEPESSVDELSEPALNQTDMEQEMEKPVSESIPPTLVSPTEEIKGKPRPRRSAADGIALLKH